MNPITLYTATCRGNVNNAYYPHKVEVYSLEEFRKAVAFDHVCAEYLNGHRSNDDFISADGVMFDCDNDHSEEPSDWILPEHITAALPGVAFYICYSRHHNRQKNNYGPRPRFHIYFSIDRITDEKKYTAFKKSILYEFPNLHLDSNARDAARFFFGVKNPKVDLMGGEDN